MAGHADPCFLRRFLLSILLLALAYCIYAPVTFSS